MSRRISRASVCVGLVAGMIAWSLQPARAAAYAEPSSFGQSVMLGGGGEKFFTGSPAEGYTCQVCHAGATGSAISVLGFPVEGYLPGQTYPITIDWSDDLPAVGLNLEVTDAAGNRFGDLAAMDPAALSPDDLCSGGNGVSATEVFDLSNGRRVLTVAKCGQHQTTFQWRAPTQPGQGWLSGSVVVANRKKDVLGDGVTNISRVFGVQGGPAPQAADFVGSCSVVRPQSQSVPPSCVLLVLVVSGLRRRPRRKPSY